MAERTGRRKRTPAAPAAAPMVRARRARTGGSVCRPARTAGPRPLRQSRMCDGGVLDL